MGKESVMRACRWNCRKTSTRGGRETASFTLARLRYENRRHLGRARRTIRTLKEKSLKGRRSLNEYHLEQIEDGFKVTARRDGNGFFLPVSKLVPTL